MMKREHAPTPLQGLWHNVCASPVTLPAGQAKHSAHRRDCMNYHRGLAIDTLFISIWWDPLRGTAHTPTHTFIQIQPLYHISGPAEKSYIPVDALVFSCTVIRFSSFPLCVTSSFIFMWVRSLPKGSSDTCVCGCVCVNNMQDPEARKCTQNTRRNKYIHKPSQSVPLWSVYFLR